MDGVSIDLGTANTVVWHPDNGVLLDEPSVMALRLDGGRPPTVIGVGREAQALVGRAPDGIDVVWPLQDGVITDLETTRRFLREILHGIAPGWWQRRRLSVVIGVPAGSVAALRSPAATTAAPPPAPAVAPIAAPLAPPRMAPRMAPPTAPPPILAALELPGASPSR